MMTGIPVDNADSECKRILVRDSSVQKPVKKAYSIHVRISKEVLFENPAALGLLMVKCQCPSREISRSQTAAFCMSGIWRILPFLTPICLYRPQGDNFHPGTNMKDTRARRSQTAFVPVRRRRISFLQREALRSSVLRYPAELSPLSFRFPASGPASVQRQHWFRWKCHT